MTMFHASRVYVIAEAGVNHNGSKEFAFSLVDAAAAAGADAVKFQTFDAKKLATKTVSKAHYQKETTGGAESQLEMLTKLELPRPWHKELQTYAHAKGIEFLSTAFDSDSLSFLQSLDLPFFKVPSGELTNAPLLWQFAKTGKPLVLSTGMAMLSEVEAALAVVTHANCSASEPASFDEVWRVWATPTLRQAIEGKVALLHCTSQYPTAPEEVNLCAMDTLKAAFSLPVGYSDHTEGTLIPVAAVARGARIIEKHFTLDRTLPGPDHRASLEPDELTAMVSQIRMLECAMGDGKKVTQGSEWDTRQVARQQIVLARPVSKGAALQRADLTTSRCGAGLPASLLWDCVGKVATRDYAAGDLLQGVE